MRPLRTFAVVLLVTAVVGVIVTRPRNHHAGTKLAVTAGSSATGNKAANTLGVPAGVAPLPDSPPTSGPPPTVAVTSVPGRTTGNGPVTTILAGRGPTGTTSPPVAPGGPAAGRLAVTLTAPGVNGGSSAGPLGIATMAADGRDRQVLARGRYTGAQWTPDGRFVVFAGTATFVSWAVPAAGGPMTRLADAGSVSISPDGTRIAYSTISSTITIQPITETSDGLVPTGAATTLLVHGVGPIWSPDGSRLLYQTAPGPKAGLGIVNADGTDARELLSSVRVQVSGFDHPGFSSDGATISFLGSDSVVYFIGADGHNLRPALPDSTTAFSTAWSTGHDRLAVLTGGAGNIVVVDAGGHVQASVHLPVQGFPIGLSFDATGRHVYYMGIPRGDMFHSVNLYSIGLDGGGHQLADDGSILIPPSVTGR